MYVKFMRGRTEKPGLIAKPEGREGRKLLT